MTISSKSEHDEYLKQLVCSFLSAGKNPWDILAYGYHGPQYNGHHGNCYQGANALLLRMASDKYFGGDPRWFTTTQVGQENLRIANGATPTYAYTFDSKDSLPCFVVYELFNAQQLKGKTKSLDHFATQHMPDVNAAQSIVAMAVEKLNYKPVTGCDQWQDIFEQMSLSALEKLRICPGSKLPLVIANDPVNPKHRMAAKGLLQAVLGTNTLLEKCNMQKSGTIRWAAKNNIGPMNDSQLPVVWLEALKRNELSLIETYEVASRIGRYLTPPIRQHDYANEKIKSAHERSSWIREAHRSRA